MVQVSENPLLDPTHLARIDDLSLLARVVVEGSFPGLHKSRRQGQGNEFFQYRAYEPGEDIKNVDWKVFAKIGQLVSKTYQESTNANLIIVMDASASMGYKGELSGCTKFRYAQMLAACIFYLGYRQGDRIGLFGGSENFLEWKFPSGGNENFKNILTCIGGMQPSGSDFGTEVWEKFKSKLPGQATVVVISDFLENENKLAEHLSFASSNRYECISMQVIDPVEETLPVADAVRFVELEGGHDIQVSPERIRSDYCMRMGEHISNLSTILASTGSEFCTLRTNQELGLGIREFLGRHRAIK